MPFLSSLPIKDLPIIFDATVLLVGTLATIGFAWGVVLDSFDRRLASMTVVVPDIDWQGLEIEMQIRSWVIEDMLYEFLDDPYYVPECLLEGVPNNEPLDQERMRIVNIAGV